MKPCRTKYKKAINKYKYDRVVVSPLSRHCRVRVACYDGLLYGWLLGDYLFVAIPEQQSLLGLLSIYLKNGAITFNSTYFRYYIGDNHRKDHVMYYETGLECKF
jgi:hypothetical protein